MISYLLPTDDPRTTHGTLDDPRATHGRPTDDPREARTHDSTGGTGPTVARDQRELAHSIQYNKYCKYINYLVVHIEKNVTEITKYLSFVCHILFGISI